jgi:hypothetical protein
MKVEMKIKKSDLTRLIESYINEQMSVPVNADGDSFGSKYPESITTDNQKAMYDISNVADRRRLSHPDSEAGLNLRWPQDFVIFEEQFEQHIADLKLFKREYPKSAFVLQLLDISGVSGYGDLAESIEVVYQGNPSYLDQAIFFINIISVSPIGLVIALFGGRLGLKAISGVANATRAGEVNGLKLFSEIMKSPGKFGDLITPERLSVFFSDPKVIAVLERTGIEVTEALTENCVLHFSKFLKFLDSFGFRAFMKVYGVIQKNFGDEVTLVIVQWLASETGQEFIKTSKVARWLFEKAPNEISKYLKSES